MAVSPKWYDSFSLWRIVVNVRSDFLCKILINNKKSRSSVEKYFSVTLKKNPTSRWEEAQPTWQSPSNCYDVDNIRFGQEIATSLRSSQRL